MEGKWITYGGYFGAKGKHTDPLTSVDVFDPDRAEWTQMTTSGTPPSGVVDAVCVAIGPLLYHIGGRRDKIRSYNTVHCLDMITRRWRELQPANPHIAPMKKYGLAGISYGNTVITVGGYGDLHSIKCHQGVEYVRRSISRGWTNEVVCYNTEQSECIMHVHPILLQENTYRIVSRVSAHVPHFKGSM